MAKFNVMINLTRTIEKSVEIEVTAKDEEAAQAKAEEKIQKVLDTEPEKIDEKFDWEETSNDDEFEYDVSEA